MNKYDIIVAGGGISGVAAAVSAAREGLSVLLIEKTGCLGGALTNSLVYPFCRYSYGEKQTLVCDGIFTEMRKRNDAYDDDSWETFKFVFDDMITEAGVNVLFHSAVISAQSEDRRIKSVTVASKGNILSFEGDFFIDTTGDGELIALTGCAHQLGREKDSLCQPMTTCFRLGNVDTEAFKQDIDMLQERYKQYRADGKIKNPRENILIFDGPGDGILHFNTTRIVRRNPVDGFDISSAEITARKQIWEMVSFLKENSKAFANSVIVSVASHIGVRESRKLKGKYILTGEDLKNMVHFEDSIALGNYDIDIHSPEGTGTYIYPFKNDEFYYIPYRSLLPNEYDNMLVAGRCISADHEAQSAIRIMPICACLGEAAGVAASVIHYSGANAHSIDIKALQNKLKEKGAAF